MVALVLLGMVLPHDQPGLISKSFIYESAPFPECHASTIVETPASLVAAWFGGTHEKHKDVCIWISRQDQSVGKWSAPTEAANGMTSEGKRYPTWNPVLHQPEKGPLLLFYKVGENPKTWWGELKRSSDGGVSWSAAERLPDGILGPIKNKPVTLADGTLLCGSSTEHQGWRLHFERTRDLGKTWETTKPIHDGKDFSAIQPTILLHPHGRLQALSRTRGAGKIVECWSEDGGKTWSNPAATTLPNPNSGIDGVTLRDGRHLLVYNHVGNLTGRDGGKRSPLNVAVSTEGKTWQAAFVLESEPGEYSYPAVIQARDGRVHITYTWNRKRVRHVIVDPARLELRPLQ
jgi:predicted neuraminidase